MSALDKVIVWAKETQHEDLDEANSAREELELLREAAFEDSAGWLSKVEHKCIRCGWGDSAHNDGPHSCRVARILRTDPERARKMGLGWAL